MTPPQQKLKYESLSQPLFKNGLICCVNEKITHYKIVHFGHFCTISLAHDQCMGATSKCG